MGNKNPNATSPEMLENQKSWISQNEKEIAIFHKILGAL